MTLFLLNIMLAVLWCFTWGSFDFYTLATGLALAYFLLGIYSRVTVMHGYGTKVRDLIRFSAYFVRVLFVANVQVAYEILTPPLKRLAPRIVRFDVTGLTPVQRTVLVNSINLTPGTLVVDMSPDRKTFYVYYMYARQREDALRQLNYLKQRLVSEVFS
jgi:multicomponent Na+:H+ antiporter subunit E